MVFGKNVYSEETSYLFSIVDAIISEIGRILYNNMKNVEKLRNTKSTIPHSSNFECNSIFLNSAYIYYVLENRTLRVCFPRLGMDRNLRVPFPPDVFPWMVKMFGKLMSKGILPLLKNSAIPLYVPVL